MTILAVRKPKRKRTNKPKTPRPVLIKCGRAYVSPTEVAAVIQVKAELWVVKLKSEPNAQYPIWLHDNGSQEFLSYFNIPNIREKDEHELQDSNFIDDPTIGQQPIRYR